MKRHPQLAKKLVLLYALQVNSSIRSNVDLARQLGVSKQAITRWCRGTATSEGDNIPFHHLESVNRLFELGVHWFTLGYEDFEAKVRSMVAKTSDQLLMRPRKISLSLLPLTSANIVGRQKAIKLLDKAWDSAKTNVIQLIAFGGVGKSSSVNVWLSKLDKENYRNAERVYAWSFYWQGSSSELNSSGDFFIEHALEWFGDQKPTEGTLWAKATRLANLIRESKTLLILDGLEPIQYPPGPKCGQVENPAVALLLRELASDNKGLCVVTSRLEVADLTPYQDGRVQLLKLENLSTDASKEMLKSLGVHGKKEHFLRAIEQYSGHALSLFLLGGYLKVVHRGDIGKFTELRSLLDDKNFGIHVKGLMRVYLDWFKNTPERALLYMVGLFDRAVSLRELKALTSASSIKGLTAELANLSSLDWSYAVNNLDYANLISVDCRVGDEIIDCHPLVRDFLVDYLSTEQIEIWEDGKALIFHHLAGSAVDNPSTMAEMEPLFRAVIHGTQAGLYEEAFRLYFDRIKKRYPMLTEGSHHADQTCIRAFFEKTWSKPIDKLPQDAQFHLISSAATNLMSLGMVNEAIEPSRLCIEWFLKHSMWLEATGAAAPFASMLIASGELNEALALLEEMQECIAETKNSVIQAIALTFQAHAYHLNGQDENAKKLFEEAEYTLLKAEPDSPVTFPTISSYYCKFLLETDSLDQALNRSLRTFAWRERKSWQVAIDTTSLLASDILVLGLIFLKLGDHVNAGVNLEKQVELLRSADEWLYLPTGLNSRAMYHLERNNFEAAAVDLEEALAISLRTGAKLGEWESYLNFAQLYFRRDNYKMSKRYLLQAKGMQGMSAYKFRNKEIHQLEDDLARHSRLEKSNRKSKKRVDKGENSIVRGEKA